jgi:dolichyl-phosphate-mannose-protein mannosyltransferase
MSARPFQAFPVKQDEYRSTLPRWLPEMVALVLIALTGAILRSADSPVEHFDEGVYASNLFFGEANGYRFPNQHLYAPPLLPSLVEWSFVFFGAGDSAAHLPMRLFVAVGMGLVWWLTRRWFDAPTALVAVLLLAVSWPNLLFSMAVLTDIPVTVWMLAAVGCFVSGLADRRWGLVVAGGMLTGLAWWTKYSGWLPLPIAGTSLMVAAAWPGRSFHGKRITELWPRIALWALACLVAVVCWSPWLWALQSKGGYAAVAANHRGYVVGLAGWLDSALAQLRYHASDWPTLVVGGAFVVTALLGAWWRAWDAARDNFDAPTDPSPEQVLNSESPLLDERFLGRIALGVWAAALLLTIPLYRPYFRLCVPLDVPVKILLAAGLVSGVRHLGGIVLKGSSRPTLEQPTPRPDIVGLMNWAVVIVGVACVPAAGVWALSADYRRMIACERDGYRTQRFADACRSLGRTMQRLPDTETGRANLIDTPGTPPHEVAVYVYGEPAILFQLRMLGFENAVPVSHLGFARPTAPPSQLPTFVIVGPHARKSGDFARQWAESSPRLKQVGEVEVDHGWIVRYEEPDWNRRIAYTLYRVE